MQLLHYQHSYIDGMWDSIAYLDTEAFLHEETHWFFVKYYQLWSKLPFFHYRHTQQLVAIYTYVFILREKRDFFSGLVNDVPQPLTYLMQIASLAFGAIL